MDLIEKRKNGLIALIDWCSFTLPPGVVDIDQVCKAFKLPEADIVEMPKGLNGYSKQRAIGDIRILYAGNSNMGIHVMMSGQGCRQFETYYTMSWRHLMAEVENYGGHYTRLDLAVDDIRYDGDPPHWFVRQLVRKVKRNECRSKFKSAIRMEGLDIGSGESTGDTLYCGSSASLIKMRAYEKDLERLKKRNMLEEGLTTWNRFEIECRDDRADTVAEMLIRGASAGAIALGVIGQYINFVDKIPNDENKARWPVSSWWQAFLDDVGKLRLAARAPDKTIDAKREWLERQMAPTMAQVLFAAGFDYADLVDFLEDGLERMTEAQWTQLEQYKTASAALSPEQRAMLKALKRKKRDADTSPLSDGPDNLQTDH